MRKIVLVACFTFIAFAVVASYAMTGAAIAGLCPIPGGC